MGAVLLEGGGGGRREHPGWPGREGRRVGEDEGPASEPIPAPVQVRRAPRRHDWVWMAGVVGCGLVALAIAAKLTVRVQPGDPARAFAGATHTRPKGAGVLARSDAPPPNRAVNGANGIGP